MGAHGRPLRILCLHGQNSNSDVTLMQLSNLGLGHRLWCDLLEGPWDADGAAGGMMDDVTDAELHSWWPWRKAGDEPERPHLARCVRYVLHYLDSATIPYDGIYGFSQGAAIATLASMPEVRKLLGITSSKPSWRFTICAHGMYPGGAWFGHKGGESMSGLSGPTLDPSLATDAHFAGVPAELLAKVVAGAPHARALVHTSASRVQLPARPSRSLSIWRRSFAPGDSRCRPTVITPDGRCGRLADQRGPPCPDVCRAVAL